MNILVIIFTVYMLIGCALTAYFLRKPEVRESFNRDYREVGPFYFVIEMIAAVAYAPYAVVQAFCKRLIK